MYAGDRRFAVPAVTAVFADAGHMYRLNHQMPMTARHLDLLNFAVIRSREMPFLVRPSSLRWNYLFLNTAGLDKVGEIT